MNKNSFLPSPYYKTPETFSGVTSDLEKMLREEVAPKLSPEEFEVLYQRTREYITSRTSAKLDVFKDMKSLYAELPKVLNGADSSLQSSILGKLKSSDIAAQAEKALDSVKTNVPGGKEILQAGEQIAEKLWIPDGTVDAGKLAKKAGTVVQAVATDVQEQAGKVGEKLDEWGLGKFWKGFLEMIGALFAALGLDKFFDVSKFLKKDGKQWETASTNPVETAAKKAEQLKERVSDEVQKLQKGTWDNLVKSGFIKDPVTQLAAFNKVWKNYGGKIEEWMGKVLSNVSDKKEWNVMEVLLASWTDWILFLKDLIKEWVIPPEAITAKIKEWSKLMIEFGLRSALTLVTKWPKEAINLIGEYWFEELMENGELKATFFPIVYHHMAIPLFLAGKASKLLSTIALAPLYWEKWTLVPWVQSQYFWATWQFNKSANVLLDYMKEIPEWSAQTKWFADDLRKVVWEIEVKMRIVDVIKNSPDDSFDTIKKGLTSLQTQYSGSTFESWIIKSALVEMEKSGGMKWKEWVVRIIENADSSSASMWWGDRVGKTLKWAFKWMDDTDLMLRNVAEEARSIRTSLWGIIKENWTLAKHLRNVALGFKQSKIIPEFEKANITILAKDWDDAKEIIQRITRETPSAFEGLFRNLWFTIVIADVASTKNNKLTTLAKDIAMMNPLYGASILIYEWMDVEHGYIPKHPGYIVAGWAVGAIGIYELSKVLRAPNKAVAFAEWIAKPVIDAGKFWLDTIRFARHAYIGARNIWGMAEIGTLNIGRAALSQNVRFGASFATALAIGFWVYKLQEDEKIFNELKGEGIVQADGGINTAKAKEKIASLPSESKEKVIKMLSEMLLWPGRTSGSYAWDISFDGSKVTALVDVTRDDTGRESLLDVRWIEEWKTALKDLGFDGTINYTWKAESYMKKYLAQYEKIVSPEMRKELYSKVWLSHIA